MQLKFIIFFYYLFQFLISPIYFINFIYRILQKKEDPSRFCERFGIPPKNIKKSNHIIWVHGVSIGESLAALTLVNAMRENNIFAKKYSLDAEFNSINKDDKINYLITTGTTSSSDILKNKLPKDVMHQFLPIDNIVFINNFLNYWQPRLAIFIESEIWPGLICETAKRCNLLLFNARLSNNSFYWWQKNRFFFKMLLAQFKEIIVQSDEDLKKFQTFIKNKVINLGNIKFANKKLEFNSDNAEVLKNIFYDKKVILFASTHAADEKIILQTIKQIKKLFPHSYFILVMRHPSRINQLEKLCKKLNLTFTNRGTDKSLPNLDSDLYIVDTFNELGLFYNIAHITFVGGSFQQGGHSPLEAAHFKNVIIFGPDMGNCQDIANLMLVNKAGLQIADEKQLQNLLEYFLLDKNYNQAASYKQNALNFVNSYQQVLQNYLSIIIKYI